MTEAAPLTDLLGDARAQIVTTLHRQPATTGELADLLGITATAVRRHLTKLSGDALIDAETVRDGSMGRPHDRWSLTRRGRRLFADRSAEFADELLDHLESTYGRGAVMDFLKARSERNADRYATVMAGQASAGDRARALAGALTEDGFAARVEAAEDGRTLTLLQNHCAIQGIAEEHPEICAHEAALFKRLLGTSDGDVKVSRRQTIAAGADACVCHIDLPADPAPAAARRTPDLPIHADLPTTATPEEG